MKTTLLISLILGISGVFWYDHHLSQVEISRLSAKLSDQANQREALQGCIDTAHGAYQTYLDSYVENTGTALYPDYKTDKSTRDWLDQRLKNDLDFCNQEFSAKNW